MTMNFVRGVDLAIRVAVVLLAAGLILAAVLVIGKKRPEPLPLSPSALRSVTMALPQVDGAPGGALVARPLFWEARRPYNAPEAVVEEEAPQPSGPTVVDDMELVGIIAAGTQSGIIVRIRGQRQRIFQGEEVEGWELSTVGPVEAVFQGVGRDGEVVESRLRLEHHGSSTGAAGVDRISDARERFAPARAADINNADTINNGADTNDAADHVEVEDRVESVESQGDPGNNQDQHQDQDDP